MSTEYPIDQALLTLCALSGQSAAERPSSETLAAQEQRILQGINAQLSGGTLATGTNWVATWLGLTKDRANLVYIAQGTAAIAVVLRGTVGGAPIDTLEDMNVSSQLPFAPASSQNGKISAGAMQAFTETVSAPSATFGDTLLQRLELVLYNNPGATVFITGHSLGGAIATTLSMYLKTLSWMSSAPMKVYTFAAPTAGDAGFATAIGNAIPSGCYVGYWNYYDVVPHAWSNLDQVKTYFPPPGPKPGVLIPQIIKNLNDKVTGMDYTQPSNQTVLNSPPASQMKDLGGTQSDGVIACWAEEVGFQHNNNTYLALLGQLDGNTPPSVLNLAPQVTGLSPASGPAGGRVTITGKNFTPDAQADFGVIAASTIYVSETQLTAISPPGVGIVPVTVTNMFGTSATKQPGVCYEKTAPPDPGPFCIYTYPT
ncbi:MAG TPA: IPT/TIG domain-containing protein [Thermoanaerobaculia bacterium]|nr:IPT/TIG domain-containing protein [Thermoanaerobaculia bacterium]